MVLRHSTPHTRRGHHRGGMFLSSVGLPPVRQRGGSAAASAQPHAHTHHTSLRRHAVCARGAALRRALLQPETALSLTRRGGGATRSERHELRGGWGNVGSRPQPATQEGEGRRAGVGGVWWGPSRGHWCVFLSGGPLGLDNIPLLHPCCPPPNLQQASK